jgi:hypothetical protein
MSIFCLVRLFPKAWNSTILVSDYQNGEKLKTPPRELIVGTYDLPPPPNQSFLLLMLLFRFLIGTTSWGADLFFGGMKRSKLARAFL